MISHSERITLTNVFEGINGYTVIMNWESCPNTFVYESKDINKVLWVYDLLNTRLNNYMRDRKYSFITSDIEGLQYVKK
jgi:hypothetical protein